MTDDAISNAEANADTQDWAGRHLEVTVGPVAHGGHCVARHSGRVIFVRHALPGERVGILVTEDRGGSFCRADAVDILEPSADRVPAPCPQAKPGGCGGCDFQHVSLAGQRRLKAAVVTEQLQRLAGIEREVTVQALDDTGLGWRRRIRYAVSPGGQLGLRAHRSHQVIALQACPLGSPGVGDAEALTAAWPGVVDVEVAADDNGEVAVLKHSERPGPQQGRGKGRGPARVQTRRGAQSRRGRTQLRTDQVSGPERLSYRVGELDYSVSAGGFWQTHPAAAAEFTRTVLSALELHPGDRVLDLYAGSGLFTVAIAAAVGPSGAVLGLEADPRAVADSARNLTDRDWAAVRHGSVTADSVAALADELDGPRAVVLDPPRAGAGRDVMAAVLASGASVVAYVACDPAALARDLRFAQDAGWELADLTAFDAFSMTHHVECIAILRPSQNGGSDS